MTTREMFTMKCHCQNYIYDSFYRRVLSSESNETRVAEIVVIAAPVFSFTHKEWLRNEHISHICLNSSYCKKQKIKLDGN